MFGDQTPSNIVWWPNKLMLKWVAERFKHVWSNTDETIDTSRWASVARMRASNNVFDTRLSYAAVQKSKTSPIKHADKRNVLRFWSNVWWPSNFIKHDQIRSNTIKQHQTRCPNGKMFGHQTMFDGVWSPNIYCLSRPKRLKHVWSNTDETIDTSRWASVVRMPASNVFDTRRPNEQNIAHQTREQKKFCKLLIECSMVF